MTKTEVRELLLKLKRQMGRERGRVVRMYNADVAKYPANREFLSPHAQRCWYEANTFLQCMCLLDRELRKIPKPKKAKK